MSVSELYVFLHLSFSVFRLCCGITHALTESWDALWSLDERLDIWIQLSLSLSGCYTSCCCSSRRSRCVYLLCHPLLPVPLSLQYGSSVWEAAIPLFLRPHHLLVLLRRHNAHPTQLKRLAPNHCDTWHLSALCRFCLQPSFSSIPGLSSRQSLLQIAAILLLLKLPIYPPLLHSNQIM